MTPANAVEVLLRQCAPQALTALVRRYRDFENAEDAVQEALLAAATQWPDQGIPEHPVGWLITVAARKMTDLLRREQAGRLREERVIAQVGPHEHLAPAADVPPESDDTPTLLLLCCHPSLSPASQIALTLRAVGGLGTAEIARAFLTPEATMAQRITRAKQRIRAEGATFGLPPTGEVPERLRAVLHVLYLIFNEGYTATSGPGLLRTDLTGEAIRLTRMVHRALPHDGEVVGLLALMLLTEARRPARVGSDGSLVPLADQDRGRWDQDCIEEGRALLTRTLSSARVGPYQLQAAVAAVHSEALTADQTDWPQIVELYRLLDAMAPSPMVALSRAVAVAMVHGPHAGLTLLEPLRSDARLSRHHRLHAVRAHLLEMAGDHHTALEAYRLAARLTTSLPEQHYLHSRAARLTAQHQNGEPRSSRHGLDC